MSGCSVHFEVKTRKEKSILKRFLYFKAEIFATVRSLQKEKLNIKHTTTAKRTDFSSKRESL